VWSGNIVIENVSLKPEILKMLELPFELFYSFIGKLSISVPWASLSSKPIEVILDRVYLILKPVNKEKWDFFDFNSLEKKRE